MTTGDLDAVYVVGPQKRSEELRYSLRSLAAHIPHRRVWIVGHKPRWVRNVHHIPRAQFSSKWTNSTENLRAACSHPDVSDRFIYMNDDFFALAPVPGIPVAHRGPVAEVIARTPMGRYRAGAAATMRLLQTLGIKEPLSYELHIPMVVDKARMLEVLNLPQARRIPVLHKRTLYGNLTGVGGEQWQDVKIASRTGDLPPGPWVSTTPESFTNGLVGRRIRAALPDVCRYEDSWQPAEEPVDVQEDAPPARPAARDPKAVWVDWAVRHGVDRDAAEAMTKAELQQIGS